MYNSIIVTWCIQKRDEPSLHAWQDQLISGNVSATLEHFYFDYQSEKILQAFQKIQVFIFLLIGVLLMLSYFLMALVVTARFEKLTLPTEMYCWTITYHYNKITGHK